MTDVREELCPVHAIAWRVGRSMGNAPVGRYCAYDGSMHPDDFMALLEKPGTRLTPTDKNYKVYIDFQSDEDPTELRPVMIGNGEIPDGYPQAVRPNEQQRELMRRNGHTFSADRDDTWVILGERGTQREAKFYFEHLSDEQRLTFTALLNDGKLNLRDPGYFYRLPFFLASPR